MAATKSSKALLTGVTTTQTSSPVTVSGDDADTVFLTIVQTGTATAGASLQVYEKPAGSSNFYGAPTMQYTAPLLPGTYSQKLPLDITTGTVEVTFTAQTGGTSSSCTAELGQLTGT